MGQVVWVVGLVRVVEVDERVEGELSYPVGFDFAVGLPVVKLL